MSKDVKTVRIPFSGFYGSLWSDMIDSEVEQTVENECDKQPRPDSGEYIPDPRLRLDVDVFSDALFDATDYRAAYEYVARDYASLFAGMLDDALGWKTGLEYKSLWSPREYNFQTDEIDCTIPDLTVRRLFAYSFVQDRHETLKKWIKDRHESCSGFVSFYSTDLDEWLPLSALADYDDIKISTLLHAVADLAGVHPDNDDNELNMYYAVTETSSGYQALDRAVDWRKYRAAIAGAREELRQELEAEAAERGETFQELYRCPDTPDMFNVNPVKESHHVRI
jgi:hypothetical protein